MSNLYFSEQESEVTIHVFEGQRDRAHKKSDHRAHLRTIVENAERFIPFIVDLIGNIGPTAMQLLKIKSN